MVVLLSFYGIVDTTFFCFIFACARSVCDRVREGGYVKGRVQGNGECRCGNLAGLGLGLNGSLFVFPVPPLDFLRGRIFVFSKIDG
jgi:hypothetical protein